MSGFRLADRAVGAAPAPPPLPVDEAIDLCRAFTGLLAVVPGEEGGGEHLTLVQNWPAAIEGR